MADAWVFTAGSSPRIRLGFVPLIQKFNYLLANGVVWSSLHYPAGVVPMSLVRPDETSFNDDF